MEDELLHGGGGVQELGADILDRRGRCVVETLVDTHAVVVHAREVRNLAVHVGAGEDVDHGVIVAYGRHGAHDGLVVERRGGEDAVFREVVEHGAVAADGVAHVAKARMVELDHLGAAAGADGHVLAGGDGLVDGLGGGGQDALGAVEQCPVHVEGNELVSHVSPLD